MKYLAVGILLLLSCLAFAQKPRALRYHSSPRFGLCTGTIDLYNDNSYAYESGCEETSHISYGKWRLSNDTVYFTPFINKTFRLIDTVIRYRTMNDSVRVTVLDKYGVNITNKIDLTNIFLADPWMFDKQFEDTGLVAVTFPREADSIVLFSMERIFEQPFRYEIGSSGEIIVKLNIPSNWLINSASDWNDISEFALLRRTDGSLETFTPHFYEKQIFRRIEN